MQQQQIQNQIISLQYNNSEGEKKGNIALIKFNNNSGIESIQNYNQLHQEQAKSYQLIHFQNQSYAVSSSYDKQVCFIDINSNNDKSNTIQECPAAKKVHQILQTKDNEVLMVDKHGDIYNLSYEENQFKFNYASQNLATPQEFKKLFNDHIILGDAYSKMKVFDLNNILIIENVMVPFKGLLSNVESFELQNIALLGFKFSEYNWQDIRLQRQQQNKDRNEEIQDEDQIQEDDNKVLKKNAGKQWFEFFKMKKENILDADFKADKFFTLENICKVKTLNLQDQKGLFVIASVKTNNSNVINVSIVDLEGNTVKQYNNEEFYNKIEYKKENSKFQLFQISSNSFAIYINGKKSQIKDKIFQNVQLSQGCYKFNDEDLLYIFQF